MRWLGAVILGVAGTSPLAGQAVAVRGTVRHQTTGDPIGNAVVTWLDSPSSGSYTSSEGRFQVNRGLGRLVVMAIGFRPDTVEIGDAESIDVRLEPAPLTLAPLVVAAARAISPDLAARILRDLDFTLKAPQSS